jgi:hypothetical protein
MIHLHQFALTGGESHSVSSAAIGRGFPATPEKSLQ